VLVGGSFHGCSKVSQFCQALTVISSYHFGAETGQDADGNEYLVPSHVLQLGPYKGPLYGLELAEVTSLPDSVLDSARKMANQLRADVERQRLEASVGGGIGRRRELCQLAHRILHLVNRVSTTTKENMATYLNSLQQKFAQNLSISG
jgi:DNA mismatch repair ATPase MutS